ncbi:M16 family metallopeptidase [Tsuneonella sp. HG222]
MNPRLLLSAFLLPLAACAQTPPPAPAAVAPTAVSPTAMPDWAFQVSDLPVDPEFRFGKLDNGMRYVIRRNETPAGQGMVWMWVNGGSLFETDDERGLAHFIEHMAFNGTTDIPEGEMVRLLEREGLAFGADTNASTSFDQTIYKLNLPRNDAKLLDTSLMLMRQVASEIAFSPEAVEREKGVVLSERRVGDTFSYRNTVDSLEFQYPGSRFSQRMPIGTVEALQGATSERLRGLWQRYYRPSNSAVIVIGAFDPEQVEAAIKARFASWPAADPPAVPSAGPVATDRQGATDIYVDPALSERVTVSANGPFLDEPDTVANRQKAILRQIGYGIVNRRLQRLTRADDPPFRGAGLGSSDVFEDGRTTNLIVDSGDGEWQRGLAAAQAEYRKALAYGFTQAEIAEQLANIRTSLENAAAGAATRSNAAHMNAVLSLLYDDVVPATPESSLERFRALEPLATPEAVMAALREELIPLDDPLIRYQGRTAPAGGADVLRAAWKEGMAQAVAADDRGSLGTFAYTDFGAPGTVVADTVEPVMGIRTLRFANGLMLNLKPTQLQKDRIAVELNVDGGQMLNTRDNPLATAMTSVLAQGGLGKHPIDDLQTILAGRSVGFGVQAEDDAFVMSSTTTPRDLELQLQLFAAALTDPGWRPQGEAQYRRSIESFFGQLNATPNSALANALGGILSDGDPRFTLQPKESYLALDFAKLRQDIGGRLAGGAAELALVGDFDPEQAIALVARTLGAIPAREPQFQDYAANRQRGFTEDRSPRTVRHEGAADQAVIRMTWPTRDDADFKDSLRLELLEKVMRIRLTESLREELGQTYSPGVNASQSRVHTGYGTFNMAAAVDTADVEKTRQAMLSAVEALIAAPVDDDLLLRARQPMLEAYDNALKTNSGWMSLADDAQRDPDRLARFASGKATLQALTAADVQEMARHYLDPATRLEIVALP